MCCSVSPGVRVRFSNTVLYGAEVLVREQLVHVLGYQNRVQNRAGEFGAIAAMMSWMPSFAATGNAMILPFPAVPGTMTAANVLDTSRCRDILQDMADVLVPREYAVPAAARGRGSFGGAPRVQVFKAAPGMEVFYRDEIPAAVAPYLTTEVIGADYRGLTLPNGDFVADWAEVREADFLRPARRRPAAA